MMAFRREKKPSSSQSASVFGSIESVRPLYGYFVNIISSLINRFCNMGWSWKWNIKCPWWWFFSLFLVLCSKHERFVDLKQWLRFKRIRGWNAMRQLDLSFQEKSLFVFSHKSNGRKFEFLIFTLTSDYECERAEAYLLQSNLPTFRNVWKVIH